jgi:hypothetical protein
LLRVAHTPVYDQLQLEVETWIWKLPFFSQCPFSFSFSAPSLGSTAQTDLMTRL